MIGGNNDIDEGGCKNWLTMVLQGCPKYNTQGGLVLLAFATCPVRSITIASEKWKQCNSLFFFRGIWPTYAIFWSWHIILTYWLHGKVGRLMLLKPLSLVCHSMVTWIIGTWAVGIFTEMTHQREGKMVS